MQVGGRYVEGAIEEILPGTDGCTVTGPAGGPWLVEFHNVFGGTNLIEMTGDPTGLTSTGGQTLEAETTTPSSGPNYWDVPENWDTGTIPQTGDDVWLQHSDIDILYGLDNHTVQLASLHATASYTGNVGLPNNTGEYEEYRLKELTIGVTNLIFGEGTGSGSALFRINVGSNACTVKADSTGSSSDATLPAVQWKGTNVANVVNVYKGSFGAAVYAGEVATIATVRQGHQSNVAGDSFVELGEGCTLTTVNKYGGEMQCYASMATLNHHDGELTLHNAISVTTVDHQGGTIFDRSTGSMTTVEVSDGAIYDRRQTMQAKTITNTSLYAGATFLDSHGTITFTNPLQLVECSLAEVVLDLGTNMSLARTML